MVRPLAGVGGAVLGGLVAVPGVLVHQAWWGLALTVAATGTACAALPPGWPRAGYAAGWAGTLGLLVGARPEGDYLVPARTGGYVLMVLALVLVLVSLVTLPPPHAASDRPEGLSGARGDQGPTLDRT